MTNNDGGQGWIITNVPYDPVSVIVCKAPQQPIRTMLYHSPVTTSRDWLEARVGVAVGCDERDDEHQGRHGRISFTYVRKPTS